MYTPLLTLNGQIDAEWLKVGHEYRQTQFVPVEGAPKLAFPAVLTYKASQDPIVE